MHWQRDESQLTVRKKMYVYVQQHVCSLNQTVRHNREITLSVSQYGHGILDICVSSRS